MYLPRLLLPALLLALFATPAPATLPAEVDGQPLPTLAPMLERVTPAVVNISTLSLVRSEDHPLLRDPFFRRFFELPRESQRRRNQSLGSGVVVDARAGHVLTNNHVIAKADEIRVTLHDGREVKAELLGADPETDVALLQIPAEGLTALPLADSDRLRVGDFVVEINGRPVRSATDLHSQLALLRVGERFSIELLRQGRVERLQARIADPFAGYVDGATVHRQFRGALLGEVIDESGLGRNAGVAIGRVEDGSNAWLSGLREGDVVFQVNRVRVETLDEMRAAAEDGISQIRLRRDDRLVTLVSR